MLVYKPTVSHFTELDKTIKIKNEEVLTELLRNKNSSNNLFLKFIFSFKKYNSLYEGIFSSVTPEFFKDFEIEFKDHLNSIYLTIQRQKNIVIQKQRDNDERLAKEKAERIKLDKEREETINRIQTHSDIYCDPDFIYRDSLKLKQEKVKEPIKQLISDPSFSIHIKKDIEDVEEIKPRPVTTTNISVEKTILIPLIIVIIYFILLSIGVIPL